MRQGMKKLVDLKAAAAKPTTAAPVRDPSFKELCDAYIAVVFDGAYLGLANHPDADIVARVDDIMALMLERYAHALLAGDAGRAWLERYAWFKDTCDHLSVKEAETRLDG